MSSHGAEIDDQSAADGTPEDVAVLYSWANLQGAKSASRREYRAQVRYRAAKALLARELRTQVEAEAAAAEAERAVLNANAATESLRDNHIQGQDSSPTRNVEATADRVQAARRSEAAARAAVLALREEREIAEAHSSARRQALAYEEAEIRRRQLAGPQPHGLLGGGYTAPNNSQGDLRSDGPENLQQFLLSGRQNSPGISTPSLVGSLDASEGEFRPESNHGPEAGFEDVHGPEAEEEQTAPAWLFSQQSLQRSPGTQTISQAFRGEAPGGDTLQDSRERVAARWFALKGVFDSAGPELPAMHPIRPSEAQTRLLAVFSLAGGVGKTGLVAMLGRALSAMGERVMLADTTPHGLLPIYFGSHEVRPGITQSLPPHSSADPAISLAIYDFAGREDDERQRELLTEEVLRSGMGRHRVLLDLSTGSNWLIRRLVDSHPVVLVPMAPDMNSVMSLRAVERMFRGIVDSEGRSLLPFYVLNQFDASLPLHLDVREVFRRQLGDRLLRLAIRRSPAVSEALAEGMTVLDYAPDASVSQDYRDIALWLRSISPPVTEEFLKMHRGER
jgi:cellulose synthase operon protein YhjQ